MSADLFRRMEIRMKKAKMTKFIKAEIESESESVFESDIELELKFDNE